MAAPWHRVCAVAGPSASSSQVGENRAAVARAVLCWVGDGAGVHEWQRAQPRGVLFLAADRGVGRPLVAGAAWDGTGEKEEKKEFTENELPPLPLRGVTS